MTRVLFLVSSLNIGGIENYLLRFITFSKDRFENKFVLCKHGYSGVLHDDYTDVGAEVVKLRLSYFSLFNYIKFYYLLKREKIDTVCDFTGDFSGLPLFVSKIAKVKNRIVFYRNSNNQFKKTFLKQLYLGIIKYLLSISATSILSNSEAALNNLQKGWKQKDTAKYKIIRNGIPFYKEDPLVRKRFGISDEDFVVGHTGSYRKSKNHDAIFRTVAELRKTFPNIKIVLIGNHNKEDVISHAAKYNISDILVLLGFQKNIFSALSLVDIFFFPSIDEGLPNALIEAILAERYVLTSNIAPIVEILPKEMDSVMINPNNISAYKQHIERYIRGEKFYSVSLMREWAKTTFDIERNFNEFYEVLKTTK